jgi:hypothetical protein
LLFYIRTFSEGARSIAQLKEYALKTTALHPNLWPGMNEISAMLSALDPKQDLSIPFSYHATKAFASLLEKVVPNATDYYRSHDLLMIAAIQATVECLVDICSLDSVDSLKQLVVTAESAVKTSCKKNSRLFSRSFKTDNAEALTPAGHLEKLMITLDAEVEQNGGSLTGSEFRRSVLESDIMVDMMERTLQP